MGLKMDAFVPEDCKAPANANGDGKKVGYEILIPCMPCQDTTTRRALEERVVKNKNNKQNKVAAAANTPINTSCETSVKKRTLQVANQDAMVQTQFEMQFDTTERIQDGNSISAANMTTHKGYFAIVVAVMLVGASVALL